VLAYRGFRIDDPMSRPRLEVPDGCVHLVLGFCEPVSVGRVGDTDQAAALFVSMVSGLQQKSGLGSHGGRIEGIEVALAPWAAIGLFRTTMHELTDAHVAVEQLSRPWIGRLASQLASRSSWDERFAALDTALADEFADWRATSEIRHAWALLLRRDGAVTSTELARATGWSVRRLQERFRDEVGLRPKAVSRILRLQRVLRSLDAGTALSCVAQDSGYSDQSHLNKDFRLLAGCTPTEFMRGRSTVRPGPPLGRALGQFNSTQLL
jgi:AraC-like DNA-binding protein